MQVINYLFLTFTKFSRVPLKDIIYLFACLFVCFDSLRPINNLSVKQDGSSWVEPVLS